MGRWSRLAGKKFLGWLDLPKGRRWLDVGCGNGAFTEEIIAHCAPAAVTSGQEETSLSGQTKSIMPSLDAVAAIAEGQQPKHKIAVTAKQQAHEQAQASLSGQTKSIMPSVNAAVAVSEVNQQRRETN